MAGREYVPAGKMRKNVLYEEVTPLPVRAPVPYADPALLLGPAPPVPPPAHQPAMLRSYETVLAEPNTYRYAALLTRSRRRTR